MLCFKHLGHASETLERRLLTLMTWITAIFAACTPWVQAFFQALLPFLKAQAETPVVRSTAEQDVDVQQEVHDAIDAYDHEPRPAPEHDAAD